MHGVISADCHLDPEFLPGDAFTANVPASKRDAVPQVKNAEDGPTWFCGDVRLGPSGARRIVQLLAAGKRGTLMMAAGFDPEQLRPGNPAYRIEDQEKDGVDAEVMYGALRRWAYLRTLDPATAAIVAGAYNAFMAGFCDADPRRLFALGGVPPTDPAAMAAEIAHIADLGLAGAEVPMSDPEHPVWDPYWDALWNAAIEHDVPVHIHVQDAGQRMPGPERPLVERAAFLCGVPLQLEPTLTAMLLSGMLERHPKLKVVFGEAGSGWIPYLLDRLDYEWENARSQWASLCQTPPSVQFRRQVHVTFQEDAIGPQLAYLYPNNFMWGSDYPHSDGIWPDSHAVIDRTMGALDEPLRKRIVRDNAAALYRIAL